MQHRNFYTCLITKYLLALEAQLGACLTGNQGVVEIDHEIFSTVILSIPLIQEGQLSVSGERMCTILVKYLED